MEENYYLSKINATKRTSNFNKTLRVDPMKTHWILANETEQKTSFKLEDLIDSHFFKCFVCSESL